MASCTPSALIAAAKCFPCLTKKQLAAQQIVGKRNVANRVIGGGSGICVTPSAPTRLVLTHSPFSNPSSTTIQISWTQKNSGSFITGYKVSWGTTSGGPYTNNSGTLPSLPRNYLITGLTPGTTYFIVVQAIAFAGCVSANSAEFSATTTGAPPVLCAGPLMTSLKGFWPLNDGTVNLENGNITEVCGDAHYAFAAPNTAITSSNNGISGLTPVAIYNSFAGEKLYSSAAGLNFPANQQFTFTCWVNPDANMTDFRAAVVNYGSAASGVAGGVWLGPDTNKWGVYATKSVGSDVHLQSTAAYTTTVWSFVAAGWDGVNLWISVNAGARDTSAMATLIAINNSFTIGNGPFGSVGLEFPLSGRIAGIGLWFRSLSAAEITSLYNGGAPELNPIHT